MGNPGLPAAYGWLPNLPVRPRMIDVGLSLLGTVEAPGAADNPIIMGWADEVGVRPAYSGDAVPWCGLFMATVALRAGKSLPGSPLWAKSWATFGRPLTPIETQGLGDVLVFQRDGGGHVALYIGEDAEAFHVLGGNQSDRVSITRIARDRLYAARRPIYQQQPATVQPYWLAPTGGLSTSEA